MKKLNLAMWCGLIGLIILLAFALGLVLGAKVEQGIGRAVAGEVT